MTNAERFIGDEDMIDTFIGEFIDYAYEKLFKKYGIIYGKIHIQKVMEDFFKKPVLTEDERVILRNFRERYKYIGREGTLYIAEQEKDSKFVSQVVIDEYKSDLFQFIKERRRILYRGTFERRIK